MFKLRNAKCELWIAAVLIGAATILAVLLVYRPDTTWPGFIIVLVGLPVYFLWRRRAPGSVQMRPSE